MNPNLTVVMAYDDLSTAKRAKETWDHLLHNLGEDYLLQLRLWKFEVLRVPELREAAARDAVSADLIFIAARETANLPAEVKEWIDLWLRQKHNHPSAIAVSSDPAGPCAAYLREVAQQAGMDFFAATTPSQSRPHPRRRDKQSMPATPRWSRCRFLRGGIEA